MGNRQTFQTIDDMPPIAQDRLHRNHPSRLTTKSMEDRTNVSVEDENDPCGWQWSIVTRKPPNDAHQNGVYVISCSISDEVRYWLRETSSLYRVYQSDNIRILCNLNGEIDCVNEPVLLAGVGHNYSTLMMQHDAWVALNPLSTRPQAPVFLHDRHMNALLDFLAYLKRKFIASYYEEEVYVSKKEVLNATAEQTIYM